MVEGEFSFIYFSKMLVLPWHKAILALYCEKGIYGRRAGLMVNPLDFGTGGPGLSFSRGTTLCSWAEHCILIMSLSTQVYKWVPENLLLG